METQSPQGDNTLRESMVISAKELAEWIIEHLCMHLNLIPADVDTRVPFAHYNIDSIYALSLVRDLEQWLGKSLTPTLLWDYPSIDELIPALIGENIGVTSLQTPVIPEEAIAIVGMSCRFPGVDGLESYWRLLINGTDAITEMTAERWNWEAFYDPDKRKPGTMYSRWGGFVAQPDYFDAGFFGISPREAVHVDPQQRLLMECAWEALEDAGQPPHELAGSRTGVYMASVSEDYARILFGHPQVVDAYTGPGSAHSILANRLSYFFNLTGPSVNVNTACSGSLVALHMACTSLRAGETNMALVGGVNMNLLPDGNIFFSKAGALSPDGRCKTFDARANGIVRSDGAGVIVLKPLRQALEDGNQVYAVIRGSAVNSDGRTNGIMAPNRQSQELVLQEAYARAGIAPSAVQYVEAHGTGTSLGDVIEAQALGSVLAQGRDPEQPCRIGSVKTNIGHTEAAAGIAGVIKVALAMKHGVLPANLHFETPNPMIPFEDLRLHVQAEATPWPATSGPLIAGVSGFGFGGTNAHVVLESPPVVEYSSPAPADEEPLLLPLSAQSQPALVALAEAYAARLANVALTEAADICYTASIGRSHLDYRLAVSAPTPVALVERLGDFMAGRSAKGLAASDRAQQKAHKLVWVFSGQGSHWIGMGRDLMASYPVFLAAIQDCDAIFQPLAGWSLLDELNADSTASRMHETDHVQPVIFAVQVALAALWRAWGVTPAAVVGHSLGEIAAAHVAGVLSLKDAVTVVYHRSRLMKRTAGKGKTAAVELSHEQARLLLVGREQAVTIAGTNSPSSCILAGEPEALEQLVASLQQNDVFARMVRGVDIAFHSPQMDPLVPELNAALAGIVPCTPTLPFVSTVTGAFADTEMADPAYWGRNLREPFLFANAVAALLEAGYDLFLEVSPHPVLAESMLRSFEHSGRKATVLPSLRRDHAALGVLYGSAGQLYAAGQPIVWRELYAVPRAFATLPTYPWQRERYWFDQLLQNSSDYTSKRTVSISGIQSGTSGVGGHPLLGVALESAIGDERFWQSALTASEPLYLRDHIVQGEVLLPGAAYAEMIAAALYAQNQKGVVIRNLGFKQALILPAQSTRLVQLVCQRDQDDLSFQILSRTSDSNGPWELHATATVEPGQQPEGRYLRLAELRERCAASVAVADHYAQMRAARLEYGPAFQALTEIWRGENEALARLSLPVAAGRIEAHDRMHPALLDAAFQLVAVALGERVSNRTYLPVGIERLAVLDQISAEAWCHVVLRDPTDNALIYEADLTIADEHGRSLVAIEGLRLFRIDASQGAASEGLYEYTWQTSEISAQVGTSERWLILGSTATGLCQRINASLVAAGHQADCVAAADHPAPGERAEFADWLQTKLQSGYQQLVCLWPLEADAQAEPTSEGLRLATDVVALVRALHAAGGAAPRLWCVTRGAQAIAADTPPLLAQAPLLGLLRSAALEHAELQPTLIDLDPVLAADEVTLLVQALLERSAENQQALRAGERLVPRLRPAPLAQQEHPLEWRADSAYMITGGGGGLGLAIANWMVEQGARNIVILGRRPLLALSAGQDSTEDPNAALRLALKSLEDGGAHVTYGAVDVADSVSLADFIEHYRAEGGAPIRGVVHAAGVLDDQLLYRMEPTALERVFAPKVAGSWALHQLFDAQALDFMVFCSSLASATGSVGQAHYAAANAFMDALAHYRRSQGGAALSINWGPWGEVGMAAQLSPQHFEAQGVGLLEPGSALVAMERLMRRQARQATVADIDWGRWLRTYPSSTAMPFFADLAPQADQDAAQGADAGLRALLQQSPKSEHRGLIAADLKGLVAGVMQLDAAKIDVLVPLHTLGLDSIMAIELKSAINQLTGVGLSVAYLIQGPTIDDIAATIEQELAIEISAELFASEETKDEALQMLLTQVQQSDQEEIAALLAQLEELSVEDAKAQLDR